MNKTINLYQHSNPYLLESFDDMTIHLRRACQSRNVKSILLCGSDPGVGTTMIAINLALALAQGRWKTLLIDADLRKKTVHKRLGGEGRTGLSDYLQGCLPIEESLCRTTCKNLSFIPAGSPVEHSLRLLGTEGMRTLLDELGARFDFILLDSPSLGAVSDAVAISLVADGALIVAEPGASQKENLQKAKSSLDGGAGKVLGVVVNKVAEEDFREHIKRYDYFAKEQYLRKDAPGRTDTGE